VLFESCATPGLLESLPHPATRDVTLRSTAVRPVRHQAFRLPGAIVRSVALASLGRARLAKRFRGIAPVEARALSMT